MSFLKKVYLGFLDLLFPRQCVGCRKMEVWICDECLNSITRRFEQECYRCYGKSSKGITCKQCKEQGNHILDGLVVAAPYKGNKQLDRMLHFLKYRSHDEELGDKLSVLLWNALDRIFSPPVFERMVVVPLPLHPKRCKERGFNQAEVLCSSFSQVRTSENSFIASQRFVNREIPQNSARNTAKEKGLVVRTDLLVRAVSTKSQVKVGKRAERQQNLRGAFRVVGDIDPNTFYLLVDDVCTTGSTLEECCITLRDAGAKYVWGAVVARA